MRLFDCISKHHVMGLPYPDPVPLREQLQEDQRLRQLEVDMQSAVRFDISNVADYLYTGSDKEVWEWNKDFPNLAPPFESMWLEYDMPTVINSTERGITRRDDGLMQVGFFWKSQVLGNKDWGSSVAMFARNWQTRNRPYLIAQGMVRVDRTGALVSDEAILNTSRLGDHYATAMPMRSNPMLMGSTLLIDEKSNIGNIGGFDLFTLMFTPALAISFMHCKNVEVVDAKPAGSRQERRNLHRQGVDVASFKTLVIDPMRKVLREEGESERVGIQKALHICRGHFATYSEDHPLFGKYAGTFWRPSHVRGSAEVGTVYKDYKVKAA